MRASEVLTKARDLIEEYGWHRLGAYLKVPLDDPTPGLPLPRYMGSVKAAAFCTKGAVEYVTIEDWRPFWFLAAELPDDFYAGDPSWMRVAFWNDAPGRTKGEVLDLFEHAIKRASDFEEAS